MNRVRWIGFTLIAVNLAAATAWFAWTRSSLVAAHAQTEEAWSRLSEVCNRRVILVADLTRAVQRKTGEAGNLIEAANEAALQAIPPTELPGIEGLKRFAEAQTRLSAAIEGLLKISPDQRFERMKQRIDWLKVYFSRVSGAYNALLSDPRTRLAARLMGFREQPNFGPNWGVRNRAFDFY
jgi:hypothetical protein